MEELHGPASTCTMLHLPLPTHYPSNILLPSSTNTTTLRHASTPMVGPSASPRWSFSTPSTTSPPTFGGTRPDAVAWPPMERSLRSFKLFAEKQLSNSSTWLIFTNLIPSTMEGMFLKTKHTYNFIFLLFWLSENYSFWFYRVKHKLKKKKKNFYNLKCCYSELVLNSILMEFWSISFWRLNITSVNLLYWFWRLKYMKISTCWTKIKNLGEWLTKKVDQFVQVWQ